MKYYINNKIETLFDGENGKTYKIEMENGCSTTKNGQDLDEIKVIIKDGSFKWLGVGDSIYESGIIEPKIIFENTYFVESNDNKFISAMKKAINDFNYKQKINERALSKFNSVKKEKIKKDNEVYDKARKLKEEECIVSENEIKNEKTFNISLNVTINNKEDANNLLKQIKQITEKMKNFDFKS